MKKLTLVLMLLFSASFFHTAVAGSQSVEVNENDTINVTDANGLKQGYWKIFGRMKNLPGYKADQLIEEGNYKNSRKTGLWKKYFPSEKLQSEITYSNNRPSGPYTIYYENGQVEEQGNWKSRRNTGDFKRWHKNGNVAQEFKFNETGKRDGVQKYYHENGQIELEVSVKNGKENGDMKRWYANGDLKEEKTFNDGVVDAGSVKTYEPKNAIVAVNEGNDVPDKAAPEVGEDKPNPAQKVGVVWEGRHTLYNKNKQITKDGIFKRGKLWKGKWHKYDENGIKVSIEMFENGRYIGNAPLEEE